MIHLFIENHRGLIVDVRTTHATGRAEYEAVEAMIAAAARGRRATLGADKAYDPAEHVANLRVIGVTPYIAQNLSGRRSTAAPPATAVMRSASGSESASRNRSAG